MGNTESKICSVRSLKLNKDFFNVSSIRLMRFLYALGFNKDSYINKKGKENWRFQYSDALQEALDFYFYMRSKNK